MKAFLVDPHGMTGGEVAVAFATDKPTKAREALGVSAAAGR